MVILAILEHKNAHPIKCILMHLISSSLTFKLNVTNKIILSYFMLQKFMFESSNAYIPTFLLGGGSGSVSGSLGPSVFRSRLLWGNVLAA